jgi:uncharacterized integral membrane protein
MSNHNYNAISANQYNTDWLDAYPELGVIFWAIGLPLCLLVLGSAVVGTIFLLFSAF